MTGIATVARQEAIDWAIRAQDAAFDDWEALVVWLGADPHHAVLYDQATIAADEAAPASRASVPFAFAPAAVPRVAGSPRRWVPLALAASLVAAVGGGLILYRGTPEPAYYSIATAAGEHHAVELAGAVRMDMNGETRITLDHNDTRFARLDHGEALFTVTHDPAHPFTLRIGDTLVTDVGTVFDVEQDETGVRVAVGEGEVRVATPAGLVAGTPGTSVIIGRGGDVVVRRDQNARAIGAWREGQIDFTNISLAQLAVRLRRTSGVAISVAPRIAGRRVSGSIVLGDHRDAALRALGPVLGVSIRRKGDGWLWSGRAGAEPS
jgi:transmembrane sensor